MARVLVVDDMPEMRALVTWVLRRHGHHVVAAADGTTAWATLEDGLRDGSLPDLVLLDVDMPGGGGLALLGAIRGSRDLVGLPVVMVSGDADRRTVTRAGQLGVQGYVLKQDGLVERVLAAVDRCLRRTPADADPGVEADGEPDEYVGAGR